MNTDWSTFMVALLISPILILQSRWVYRDAEKKGMNKWFWGIFCLLNTPSNPLLYLLFRHFKKNSTSSKH